MKYVVVTGGVVSGLGKGVTISSMGRLLQSCGISVTAIKIDPYLNVDAGTMSPFEHGEVFVLEDGGEGDLDLGNYERFLNITLTSDHNITTGKIYRKVILQERRGDYLGKTVQVVPHITTEIQDWIERVAKIPVSDVAGEGKKVADVCLIEVGGTVGDIESSVFLEALRQFQFRVGHDNFVLCFVSLVPNLADNEQKTKPTQHGVKDLRSLGLSPQIIFCRSTTELYESTKAKISQFCHVPPTHVLSVHDVKNVYQVPLMLEEQKLHEILVNKVLFPTATSFHAPDLSTWSQMAKSIELSTKTVTIALIGKYTGLQDSYLSVIKALKHAAIACSHKLELLWVEAAHLEEKKDAKMEEANGNDNKNGGDSITNEENDYDAAWAKVKRAQGVIVPGGFGDRGFLGKVLAVQYCRTHQIPFLGVCLGFQAMVVEYCRNVMGWTNATSTEFLKDYDHDKDNNKEHTKKEDINNVVIFMPEIDKETMGGTMRLGARNTRFTDSIPSKETYEANKQKDDDAKKKSTTTNGSSNGKEKEDTTTTTTESLMHQFYGCTATNLDISERHRHRYEVNPKYVNEIQNSGLIFVGRDSDTGERMEIAEVPKYIHPYFVGVQFHPEFKSRPLKPSPPFYGLVKSACEITTENTAVEGSSSISGKKRKQDETA